MTFQDRLPPADLFDIAGTVRIGLEFPLPGPEPEPLRGCARRLRDSAELLRTCLDRVRRLGLEQSFWSGSAADEFAALVRKAPRHLNAVADRYDAYARVLDRYAGTVEPIRAELFRDRAALQTAWDQWRVAGEDKAASSRALASCVARYQRVRADYDRWVAACMSAARQLHHIDDHDPLHNPHGLHALMNAASGVCSQLSQMCALAGVLCVLVCPVAAPVFFAASAALSAAQVAADVDRAVQFGEDVSATQFAEGALGAVPFSGVGKAGLAGVRAARNSTGAGVRAARAVTASARSVGITARETAVSGLDGATSFASVGPRAAFGQGFGRATVKSAGQHWEDIAGTQFQDITGHSPVDAMFNGFGGGPFRLRPLPGDRVAAQVHLPGGQQSRRVVITLPGTTTGLLR